MISILLYVTMVGLCGVMQAKLPNELIKSPFTWDFGDNFLQVGMRYRVEGLYGKNTEFLNNDNKNLDQTVIPARYTFDINGMYELGREKYEDPLVRFQVTIRNKATWGSLDIVPTDKVPVPVDRAFTGEHYHTLNRNLLWVREIWLESSISEMLNLNFANNHTIKAGFFPFELGRGISLGAAYATDPDMIGFYSPNAVDQYAPGLKLSGTLDSEDMLGYDLYASIISNNSDILSNVRKKTLGQEYGHQCDPSRGFGYVNWLFAGRFQWHAYREGDMCDVLLEPYVLFVDQREQKIEFIDDAQTKLGTLGIAFDMTYGDLSWGFEFAQNVGRQHVKGWDRNIIEIENRNGSLVQVNTQVIAIASVAPDIAGMRALVTDVNQPIIFDSIRSQSQNGAQIENTNLQNSRIRFRNPYVNHFDGYMAVWDAMYKFCPEFKLALTAGLATGDINPNRDHFWHGDSQADATYSGFISIQEQYSGMRVQSAFVMSGAGRIPRILSFPSREVEDPFPDKISQLTNLIWAGVGAYLHLGSWKLNSNMISYWQDHPTRLFVSPQDRLIHRYASTWLGLEFNLFADIVLDNTMKFYGVASAFVPGSHYRDIQGIPLTRPQKKFLDSIKNNVPGERVPLLGTNAAFALNVGVQYSF